MAQVILKPGREKSLARRHPWVFSGAVGQVQGDPADGETVAVLSARGEFLAWAAYSSQSQIRLRVWTWKREATVDAGLLRRRLGAAIIARQELIPPGVTNAVRLVHGESDGVPGLIVDRYAGMLVMQVLSSGAERWREEIADLLVELSPGIGLYERSDVDVRGLEGLPERACPVRGEPPPERILITENGLKFWVGVATGHKTGFYLDQRANRLRVRELAAGKKVLDCFSYTGGFAVNALAGGAHSVLAVDSSGAALRAGQENVVLNGLPQEKAEWLEGDVFQALRAFRDQGRSFDLIILDPPKFAPTSAQAQRAARGYKDINLLAFKLLRPGGLLVTFSCSGGISLELFQKIVAGAALDAGVEAQIVETLHQGVDHPVSLNFPEGAYLKGLVVLKR